MKLAMNMLRQYVDIPVTPEEYTDRMIMTGTAVEGVEDISGGMDKVVVGRVLTCEDVEGTHLHQCTVDVGGGEPLHIVCGAPNVAAGELVPVALDGARLPGGVKIKKGKLRGMTSEGMICSGEELGVPNALYPNVEDKGILVFQEDYPLGADVRPLLGIDDTAVDFEILANRPDCLCAIGIARETAAALGTVFHAPEIAVKEAGGDIHNEVKIRVEAPDLCPRYAARVIKNVRIKPSPLWLRKYLHGAGLRAINNIVDITNYIMLEYGHPMHAFDLSKVRGRQIVVRRAHEGETLTTLDGNERALRTDDLVICDEERATGLAGIMGGEESEIVEGTREVMFECAAFDRTAIRLTSRALGMRTEASGRFERGVAPGTVMEALERACQLVNELDAGDVVTGAIDLYPAPKPQQTITASVSRIQERAGVAIPAEDMVQILHKLQFGCERNGDTLTVTVPAFREDLDGEADICEECLRIYGYEHIGATALRGETTQGGVSPMKALKNRVARLLTGMGYLEIMNFSFTGVKEIQKLGLPQEDPRTQPMPIRNPLGEDAAVMRPTLACDMLRTLAFNMNHSTEAASLYEMAAVFDHHHLTQEGLPTETQTLCLGAYGADVDFFTVRGAVEAILHASGIACTVEPGADAYYHPGRSARLTRGGVAFAQVGEVHPAVRERFDMPKRAVIAEVNLQTLLESHKPMGEMKPLPRFPAMARDLALVMDEGVAVGPLMGDMRKAAGKLLESIQMFDVYRGVQVGVNKKSVAFSLTFRAPDRTLTDEEVQKAMDKVRQMCAQKYQAAIRG
ncbi:MAG: phenylalanine--tRNA ligase subunit beta [Clostridiales bacterium]|nr:phenylalanine--tRNA ligase subunit beta [Clostridiales bacterium]MDO4350801.1 phenylalanine--tRNA ligase subunit beta [Eubacteriales bacterium]MDY4007823.1 phenylalanine--tRNA ligase subunit beta [Candidatus Limiplasma sp.]